jgi:hypothetical protein
VPGVDFVHVPCGVQISPSPKPPEVPALLQAKNEAKISAAIKPKIIGLFFTLVIGTYQLNYNPEIAGFQEKFLTVLSYGDVHSSGVFYRYGF